MNADELSKQFDHHFWTCEPCKGMVLHAAWRSGLRMCETGRKMIKQWSEANVVEAELRNGLSK